MSTTRTAELTLSARASGYVSLTKPDVSFLVLMTPCLSPRARRP